MDRDGVKQEQKRDESFHFPSPVLERDQMEDKQVIIISLLLLSLLLFYTECNRYEGGDSEGEALDGGQLVSQEVGYLEEIQGDNTTNIMNM